MSQYATATKEEKDRVRANARKMMLDANQLEGIQAVADVIEVTFEEVHTTMREHYQPKDPLEDILVRRIARCSWKMMVFEQIENVKFELLRINGAPGDDLQSLSVMERRLDVQLHRAIQALRSKRKDEQEALNEKVKNELPFPTDDPRPVTHDRPHESHRSYLSHMSPNPQSRITDHRSQITNPLTPNPQPPTPASVVL